MGHEDAVDNLVSSSSAGVEAVSDVERFGPSEARALFDRANPLIN